MSKYTTGEIAKLCGVTVRTVQYYDSRNILVPSELSEGGRRLYSEEDLKRMKIICFLRDLDLPINAIAQLLSEEDPASVIDLLLQQQEQSLRHEIGERQEKLDKLEELQRELKGVERFSIESIGDIANIMESKKKLKRMRGTILAVGIPLEIIEVATAVLWAQTGIWWPFALGMALCVAGAAWISVYHYKRVAYICPKCHNMINIFPVKNSASNYHWNFPAKLFLIFLFTCNNIPDFLVKIHVFPVRQLIPGKSQMTSCLRSFHYDQICSPVISMCPHFQNQVCCPF